MSKVMEILDRHVQLAMWAEHDSATEFWKIYLRDQRQMDAPLADFEVLKPETNEPLYAEDDTIAAGYAETCAYVMGMAETYYVTPDICDVIEEAAETIPREPLRKHMVPTRTGWVDFGREIVLGVDANDEPWGIGGFAWQTADGGEEDFPLLAHGISWHDVEGKRHVNPGLTIIWWQVAHWERHNELPRGISQSSGMPDYIPGQVTGWAFDIPWDPENRDSSYTLDETGERQRKLLLTTFNMLMDELIRVAKERPARGAVRRASRVLKSPDYGDVNVVELRKVRLVGYEPPEPNDDLDPVHWTHRWIVRPHWRTVNRGTVKEKHVYIRKHIKGPTGKPLIVKDRLGLLKR